MKGERRRCVYGALKNCCMESLREELLVGLLDPEHGLVAALLEPVSGRKEGEEGHEPDAGAREAAAEALLALASSEAGFEALWEAQAPEVLNAGYAFEAAPGVSSVTRICAALFELASEDASATRFGKSPPFPRKLTFQE